MIKLTVPLPTFTARTFFLKCVDGYKTETKRDQMCPAADTVEADAERYKHTVPTQTFACSPLPKGITEKDMLNLYTGQLMDKNSDGRAYYDEILNHAWNKTCPYCGITDADTLDHYLPKSRYPTMVVAPVNLLPCCMRCNRLKLDQDPPPDHAPIHAYLDDLPDGIWLHVDLGPNLEATYRVECPPHWLQLTKDRLENHMVRFNLKYLYRNRAAVEISESKYLWEGDLKCSEDELLYNIGRSRESFERVDPNSWRSALYRALEAQLPLLISYLKRSASP